MKILSFISCLWLLAGASRAQNIGIGTSTPASSAVLDISSTTGGVLLPRMTFNQRSSIQNPVAGLMIWCLDCTTSGELQMYSGTEWLSFQLGAASAPQHVGAPFGGGIIAYIFQPGDPGYVAGQTHGLIAAPDDQAANAEWGCLGDVVGAFDTALGTGLFNTEEIINECNEPGIAAALCLNLVLGGFNDWFLPSLDELNKLYINRALIGGFTQFLYWSSSEHDDFDAWAQDFTDGSQFNLTKNLDVRVRAVRYF